MTINSLIKLQKSQNICHGIVQLQMNRTVTNETNNTGLDREILTRRYLSPASKKVIIKIIIINYFTLVK